MKHFWRTVWRGLAVLIPFLFSFIVAYWLLSLLEHLTGSILRLILPGYIPGMGIIGSIILLYFIGRYMDKGHSGYKVTQFVGRQVERVPFMKTMYKGTRDLIRSISMAGQREEHAKQVVLVTLREDVHLIGFITAESIPAFAGRARSDIVAVYVPLSYQLGGFTIYLPRQALKPLDMTVPQAMEVVLSAAMAGSEGNKEKAA